ncbi:hypothetical protein [Kribbella italica]|uniref:Uncharacterized protein n=1 Tax=Kribbella italica TaxID=1540520 RepID=A0A7W9MTX3_9ACTN|nr:hypothetical protein [Kribbella italica]MBB5835590.1 hypothetical protein [Kribbella italica]
MRAEQLFRTYVVLTVVSTGASSLIWGINTLFLLDAGLSVGAAFAAWAGVSTLLGLGFTFFSGATRARRSSAVRPRR